MVWRSKPGMPILFTTGYSDNLIMQNAALDEKVRLLSKPYTKRDLALELRRILDPES